MEYLVRLRRGNVHPIVHHVHTVNGVTGALCSPTPTPAEGDTTLNGRWELLENLPPKVRLCWVCQRLKQKLDNPIPERVERELSAAHGVQRVDDAVTVEAVELRCPRAGRGVCR